MRKRKKLKSLGPEEAEECCRFLSSGDCRRSSLWHKVSSSVSVMFSHVTHLSGDLHSGVISLQIEHKIQVRMDEITKGMCEERKEEKSKD